MELSCPALECEEPSLSARTKGRVGSSISNKFREIFLYPIFLSYFSPIHRPYRYHIFIYAEDVSHACNTQEYQMSTRHWDGCCLFSNTKLNSILSQWESRNSRRVYIVDSTRQLIEPETQFIYLFVNLFIWSVDNFHYFISCWYWINTQVARS